VVPQDCRLPYLGLVFNRINASHWSHLLCCLDFMMLSFLQQLVSAALLSVEIQVRCRGLTESTHSQKRKQNKTKMTNKTDWLGPQQLSGNKLANVLLTCYFTTYVTSSHRKHWRHSLSSRLFESRGFFQSHSNFFFNKIFIPFLFLFL